jgi:hypothetical protein
MYRHPKRLAAVLAVALLASLTACATDDTTGPEAPSVADLAGTWAGVSFALESAASPGLGIDLMQMGGSMTLAITTSGSFTGLVVLPGLVVNQPGTVTIPLAGVIRMLDDTTLRIDFVPEIPPIFTTLNTTFTLERRSLSLVDPGSKFDFDGDGVSEGAIFRGSFLRN